MTVFMSTFEKVNTGILLFVATAVCTLVWGFFSALATEGDVERETKARVELEIEVKEADKELKKAQADLTAAIATHINTGSKREGRVDETLRRLDKYLDRNGG